MASPMLASHSQAAWAKMLADRGHPDDRERAQHLATAALDTAGRLGMAVVAAEAQAALDAQRS